MIENQSVVSWGVKLNFDNNSNPIVWQRNNTENRWYSEGKTVSELMESMFEWYYDVGIINKNIG